MPAELQLLLAEAALLIFAVTASTLVIRISSESTLAWAENNKNIQIYSSLQAHDNTIIFWKRRTWWLELDLDREPAEFWDNVEIRLRRASFSVVEAEVLFDTSPTDSITCIRLPDSFFWKTMCEGCKACDEEAPAAANNIYMSLRPLI